MLLVTGMQPDPIQQKFREPIGIVISDGARGTRIPKFSAFVWGPVPDDIADIADGEPVGGRVAAA